MVDQFYLGKCLSRFKNLLLFFRDKLVFTKTVGSFLQYVRMIVRSISEAVTPTFIHKRRKSIII